MRFSWILIATAAVLVLGAGVAPARDTMCPDAEYAIAGKPVGGGAAVTSTVEIGASAGLGELCPLDASRLRRRARHGVTYVRARWDSCPGLEGPVFLQGRIVDGCTRFKGAVRAKRYRRPLNALRSDCGDGILEVEPPMTPYTKTRESLAAHAMPRWFDDAKFGIMIHWGIFDIPAWAETVIDPGNGSIEVGHLRFSSLLQRKPAATEAMYLMMRRAFELGYRRYEWKCDALNAPSRAAALRLGLSYEGIFRQAMVIKGRNRDSAWFTATDRDWPALDALLGVSAG